MSVGGHSLHKKDYAALAGLAALAGTGLGAAGVGPMAGLFGGAAPGAIGAGAGAMGAGEALGGGAGIAGMGGGTAAMFGPTAAGESLLGTFGAGSAAMTPTVGEIGAGAIAGDTATGLGMPALGQSATAYQSTGLAGLLGKGAKGLESYQKAMNLAKLAQGPEQQAPQGAARPPQVQVSNDPLAALEAIYGIKRKKEYGNG